MRQDPSKEDLPKKNRILLPVIFSPKNMEAKNAVITESIFLSPNKLTVSSPHPLAIDSETSINIFIPLKTENNNHSKAINIEASISSVTSPNSEEAKIYSEEGNYLINFTFSKITKEDQKIIKKYIQKRINKNDAFQNEFLDKRRHSRKNTVLQALFFTNDSRPIGFEYSNVQNLSETGTYLAIQKPFFNATKELQIRIFLPYCTSTSKETPDEELLIKCLGHAIRLDRLKKGYGMAIFFTKVENHDKKRLSDYLTSIH